LCENFEVISDKITYIEFYINYFQEEESNTMMMMMMITTTTRGSRVRFPAGTGNFSLHHRVQNGSGAHPASYPMGFRDSFPGAKAAGA
jgi:hypothetical protein